MDNVGDLKLLLASRYPLIVAEERDEERFLSLVRSSAGALDLPVWTWSAVRGLIRDGSAGQYGTREPPKALAFIAMLDGPGVFVFMDVHPALADPIVVRQIKEIADAAKPGQTLVLTGQRADVPPELSGLAIRWRLEAPLEDELEGIVKRTVAQLRERNLSVTLDPEAERALVGAVHGLSSTEAERLIRQAALQDGRLDPSDVAYVRRAKAGLLDPTGAIELVETTGTLAAVGGMERLKEWLRVRGKGLEPGAARFGLQAPRGILLAGVPGCGKSLVAKTVAGSWGLPLVLLDPSRLYGKFLGESEERLEEALRCAEAMAPAVLWIDEIEKAFAPAGGEGDGGTSQRILGTFLRWLQEHPPGVFLVATSNEVADLPPEFLRRGRFDQVFFVDLPRLGQRREIFRLHLLRRGRSPEAFDLDRLAAATEGFSGAEIEACIVGALYRAYSSGRELDTEQALEEIGATVPLSRTRAEDVGRLRAWASKRATPVS